MEFAAILEEEWSQVQITPSILHSSGHFRFIHPRYSRVRCEPCLVDALFNYDKVRGQLIMTRDKKTVIELFPEKIKSFTLHGDNASYSFERVNLINDKGFVEALVSSKDKYSLYKWVKTKFVASDYSTDGLAETGNKYDEYRDVETYVVVFPGKQEFKTLELTKKSIKKVFARDASKADTYMADHLMDEVNEKFLVGLVTNLNE